MLDTQTQILRTASEVRLALPCAPAYGARAQGRAKARGRTCFQPCAKRLSREEAAAGEWLTLLREEDTASGELGSPQNLNELCNRGLKLMLRGDEPGLLDFRDELNAVGSTFTDQDNLPGALFIYVLFMMTEHKIVQQAENLTGIYEAAFKQVFSILEDSGWKLVREGEESEEDAKTFDDLPDLGYIQNL